MPATCMAAERAMRLAVPSTSVSNVRPALSRLRKAPAEASSLWLDGGSDCVAVFDGSDAAGRA
ncbi:hypothetical protein D3C71_994600 [compost metagenome]